MKLAGLFLASAMVAAPAAAWAATVLADFDGVQTGFVAGSAFTISVAPIGSGACSGLSIGGSSASGNALCGSQFEIDGERDTLLFVDVDFSRVKSITFSLGAFVTNSGPLSPGDFDPGQDFLSVFANGIELATFEGVEGTGTLIHVSGAVGVGTALNATFQDFTATAPIFGTGVGDLVFEFSTTNETEHLAIDSISLQTVPLPGALPLALAGFGLLGFLRARRRA